MQHTGLIGHSGKSGGGSTETQKTKVKDGSAHPHAGSHAQVSLFFVSFFKQKIMIQNLHSTTTQLPLALFADQMFPNHL